MFLVVQNDPKCPPGSCAELIESAGKRFRLWAAFGDDGPPASDRYRGLIVLGGEMGVHETDRFPHLDRVRRIIRAALDRNLPTLGICLGGQLLAQVLGGRVASPSSHGEKGICRVKLTRAGEGDPLFSGVTPEFTTFQYHNDSFTVPPGALLLAHSDLCPVQAFRFGPCGYGVQFHPEVNRAIVSSWDGIDPGAPSLLPGYLSQQPLFDLASRAIIGNFVSRVAFPSS